MLTYTFFAQFVDHDITLDTTTELNGIPLSNSEIANLPNLRTPTLDLDCVYGFGPEASPHLYAGGNAPGRLIEGNHLNPNDIPRSENGTALIGDPRNDENMFISQIQLLFIRFHNKVVDMLVSEYPAGERFEKAQEIVRHHYQCIVVEDFLKRVCDQDIYDFALKKAKTHGKYPLVYAPDKHGNLPMPVEFSGAAYRFGHTTVRNTYAANSNYTDIDLFDERFGTTGFRALPTEQVVDWRFMFEVEDCIDPLMTKGFNLLFPNDLIKLPSNVVGRNASDDERSLAFRNLLRGSTLALPSGQDVVKALKSAGYPISTSFSKLKLNEVIDDSTLVDSTPLFFYLLREAETLGKQKRMGPAASAIMLEVFLGTLLACENSYLKEKSWKPEKCIAGKKGLELADIVRFVGN